MEIAQNVREFLVVMGQELTLEEEDLLESLQVLHQQYIEMMNTFSERLSKESLSMSPEARMVAHKLRLKIYQDWRALLMDRIFTRASTDSQSSVTSPTRPRSPLEEAMLATSDLQHHDSCVCEMAARLDQYQAVLADFFKCSVRLKPKGSCSGAQLQSAESVSSCLRGNGDSIDPDTYLFKLPEFLGSPPMRDVVNS